MLRRFISFLLVLVCLLNDLLFLHLLELPQRRSIRRHILKYASGTDSSAIPLTHYSRRHHRGRSHSLCAHLARFRTFHGAGSPDLELVLKRYVFLVYLFLRKVKLIRLVGLVGDRDLNLGGAALVVEEGAVF